MIRVIVIDIRGFQVNDCLLWRGFFWVALQCQVILCTSNLRPSVLMEAVGTPNLQSLDHVGKDRGPVYIYYMVSVVSKYAELLTFKLYLRL